MVNNTLNKSCIIIGGGHSVKEGIEKDLWNKIKGKDIWSLNYAYKTMPYLPKRELWVDVSFFKENTNDLQDLAKKEVVLCAKKHNMYSFISEIKQYTTTRNIKESKEKCYIGSSGLVGFFSLSIAISEGYTEIYLLGYDWGTPDINNKKTHYYQSDIKVNSSGIGNVGIYLDKNNKPNEKIKDFEIYLKENSKIYNVSLISHINYFEKLSWENFFNKL